MHSFHQIQNYKIEIVYRKIIIIRIIYCYMNIRCVFYNKTTDNFTLSKKGFMFFLCVYFVEAPFVQYKQTHALVFAIIYGLTNPRNTKHISLNLI